jgi:hypothetical protein
LEKARFSVEKGRHPFAQRMVVKVAREIYDKCSVNQVLFDQIEYKRQYVPTSDTCEAAAPRRSRKIKGMQNWTKKKHGIMTMVTGNMMLKRNMDSTHVKQKGPPASLHERQGERILQLTL